MPTQAWRRAARLASDVEGTPAIDEALAAAHRLADALRWTRTALDLDDPTRINRIVGQLPMLAGTLLVGAHRAVERGDVFVNRTVLRRTRPATVRIRSVWQRATSADPEIVGIRDALCAITDGHHHDPAPRTRAHEAFRRPPQPGTRTPAPERPAVADRTAQPRPARRR